MTEIKVHSKALNETIHIKRVIGQIKGAHPGPTLIFIGGIHGNEPAGVLALKKFIDKLTPLKDQLSGNILAIAGNLQALSLQKRYCKEDLNRMWTQNRINALPAKVGKAENEEVAEQVEIHQLIQDTLKHEKGPFYFFDIHTTSSDTIPFLTVNDSLLNRAFISGYPLPIILGIEEYLKGPILSYINELGYVAFGFEAGQHDTVASIENAEAFCILSSVMAGALTSDFVGYQDAFDLLMKTTGDAKHIYEIFFRYEIHENEKFEMLKGFFNFQPVKKHQHLALSNGTLIKAKTHGRIFMPLYQQQGEDGFFLIRIIHPVFYKLSAWLRSKHADRYLVWLPGVNWYNQEKSALVINKQIARFFARQFFHLLGYRSIEKGEKYLIAYNREAKARYEDYKDALWMN